MLPPTTAVFAANHEPNKNTTSPDFEAVALVLFVVQPTNASPSHRT